MGTRASGQRDEDWFKREVLPKLDAFSLKEIAAATGLSLAVCSRVWAASQVLADCGGLQLATGAQAKGASMTAGDGEAAPQLA